VASLALKLFDCLQNAMLLPHAHRSVIECAALFHDIGYAGNPQAHAAESARIVAKERITGFSPVTRVYAAAVILLHQKNMTATTADPAIDSLADTKKVRECGAFLRIADGLDHSHIQDADINSVTMTGKDVVVTLRRCIYPGNIAFALQKADLWRSALKTTLQIRNRSNQTRTLFFPFPQIIRDETDIAEAARKFLYYHFRIMIDNVQAMGSGDDPEYLHDFRVFLRRFRLLMRIFRNFMPRDRVAGIMVQLESLWRKFGGLRDADVLYDYFSALMRERNSTYNAAWRPFHQSLADDKRKSLPLLRTTLNNDEWHTLLRSTLRFLRVDLPDYIRETPSPSPIERWAQQQYRKHLNRTLRQWTLTAVDSAVSMHELRKKVRNCRYIGESLQLLLPPACKQQIKIIKAAATLLGDIHDIDIAAASVEKKATSKPPKATGKLLCNKRKGKVGEFKDLWSGFLRMRSLKHFTAGHRKGGAGMTLYVMRHGIAEKKGAAADDAARALVPKGKKRVVQVCRRLTPASFKPDVIFTSPYKRALQTAEVVAELMKNKPAIKVLDSLQPFGSFNDLIKAINLLPECTSLVIGHEPYLSSLISYLLSGNSAAISLGKAGICSIAFKHAVKRASGSLQYVIDPDVIKK